MTTKPKKVNRDDLDEVINELAINTIDYLVKILPEDDPTEGKLGKWVLVRALAAYQTILNND